MPNLSAVHEGDIVWTPSDSRRRGSAMWRFMEGVERRTGRRFHGRYDELWLWSVQHIEEFWAAVWEHFRLAASPGFQCVLESRPVPGVRWFPGAQLNFAEQVLRAGPDDEVALVHLSELRPARSVTRAELRRDVRRAATGLRALGLRSGDRVAACLPNGYEAAVGLLATAAVGAVWVAVPPGREPQAAADRMAALKPRLVLAAGGYLHAGQPVDLGSTVQYLLRHLPGPTSLVWVELLGRQGPPPLAGATPWERLLDADDPGDAGFRYARLDSEQPLWAWFSAGTSGPCKALMHSHFGVLLEALVVLGLHHDLGPGRRLFAPAATGDLLWHLSMSALATGASVVLRDGHPTYPRADMPWKLAADLEVTHLALTPSFVGRMRKAGLRPRDSGSLSKLESVMLTGSPAPAGLYAWLLDQVHPTLWVAAACHCADIAGAFMAPCPLLPVRAGRLQCRALGHDVQAWSDKGEPLVGAVGELVCVQPLPSMPLGLWGDAGLQRKRATWFDSVPGVWHQGDLLRLDAAGGGGVTGRCASVLLRAGRSLGTTAYYQALDQVSGLDDALVVCCLREEGASYLPLFVKLSVGAVLDDTLVRSIRKALVDHGLEHFLPDHCRAVPDIPCTSSGDRMELPVRRILGGWPVAQAACPAAVTPPGSLAWFVSLAQALAPALRSVARP